MKPTWHRLGEDGKPPRVLIAPVRGFERIGAAIGRGPQDGRPRLGACRGGHHAGTHRGAAAARRAARGACGVPGVACRARPGERELRRDGLADDRGAGLAQRVDGGRVPARRPALEDRAADLHGHVLGLEDVLDGDRHAVEFGKKPAVPVAGRRSIGCFPCAIEVEGDERVHVWLARVDGLDAALQIGARRVGPVEKGRDGVAEGKQRDGLGIVRGAPRVRVHRHFLPMRRASIRHRVLSPPKETVFLLPAPVTNSAATDRDLPAAVADRRSTKCPRLPRGRFAAEAPFFGTPVSGRATTGERSLKSWLRSGQYRRTPGRSRATFPPGWNASYAITVIRFRNRRSF